MPSQCSLDPMDCIFQVHRSTNHLGLHKRAPPPPAGEPSATASVAASPTGTVDNPSSGGGMSDSDRRIAIIAASVGGTLLLVVALVIFSICLKKRRASRRIHQLQAFLPTFLDKDRTERYFREKPLSRGGSLKKDAKKNGGSNDDNNDNNNKPNNNSQLTLQENASHSTLVSPPSQAVVSNLHNRGKATPLARQHSLEKQGSGVFQQVLLDPSEPGQEENQQQQQQQQQQPAAEGDGSGGILGAIRRSISVRSRQSSVNAKDSPKLQHLQSSPATAPPSDGVPSVLIGEKSLHQTHERQVSTELPRFPEGEDYHSATGGRGVPSSVEYHMNRFSSVSTQGGDGEGLGSRGDMLLDPNRFSTMSVMFDARQLEELEQSTEQQQEFKKPHPHHHRTSGLSRQSTESGSSVNSSDDDTAAIAQLPDHQKLQAFHTPPPLTSPGNTPLPVMAHAALPTSMPVPFSPGAYQIQPSPSNFATPTAMPSMMHRQHVPVFSTAAVGGVPRPFDDKQELDEDEGDQQPSLLPTQPPPPLQQQPMVQPYTQPQQGAWPSSSPYLSQPPNPHQPVITRPHGGREMSLSVSDRELDTSY